MIFDWDVLNIVGKIFLKAIKYCSQMIKKDFFEEDMSAQSFGITRVPILGLLFGSLDKKCHLDVALAKNQKIFYRERSGASFQRLQAM